jgi:hypothetical protein
VLTLILLQAVLRLLLVYQGFQKEVESIFQPFESIQPISVEMHSTDYPGISKVIEIDEDSPGCQPPGARHAMPISLKTYNITAMGETYSIFNTYTANHEALSRSHLVFESYSVQAARIIPGGNSAVFNRQFNILVQVYVPDELYVSN